VRFRARLHRSQGRNGKDDDQDKKANLLHGGSFSFS
jgi:hypothetical protein